MDSWLHDAILANLQIVVDYWAAGDIVRAERVCGITWPMLGGDDFIDVDRGAVDL